MLISVTVMMAQLKAGRGPGLAAWGIRLGCGLAGSRLAASYQVSPMSPSLRMSLSVSEQASLDSLLVSPPVSSSQQTFVLTLLSPFGLVSDLTTTSFSHM